MPSSPPDDAGAGAGGTPVLYVVVCAAPPARQISRFISQAQAAGWAVCAVLTPLAAEWLDTYDLARLTGHPVLTRFRTPDDPPPIPADAMVTAPATFNTINKWAAGISDTLALGLLNEALGLRIPIVAAPYTNDALIAHPAFSRSLRFLADCGVTVLPTNAIQPTEPGDTFVWSPVLDALPAPPHHPG